MTKFLFSSLLLLLSFTSAAGGVFSSLPKQIDAQQKYVFYSHGLIVEGDNPTPIHARWGMYDFPAIIDALSDDEYNLIAFHRPKDTHPENFARKLATDVDRLVNKGVPYEQIYLVGFSRGGEITALTANFLASESLQVIILAGCGDYIRQHEALKVFGRVYSIYETSDTVGSCQFLTDRNPAVIHFNEIAISTGKAHGTFYRPIAEWVMPVKSWIKQR